MDMSNLSYPDGYNKPPKAQVEVFKTWVWYNQEVCNECFTQVRHIGDEITIQGPIHTHRVNEYYERSIHGVQEHTAFEMPADRFGTTFCKECGADTHSLGYTKNLEELTQDAKRIIEYVNPGDEPPYTIDGEIMARTLKDFKRIPENTGYDTEILATRNSGISCTIPPRTSGLLATMLTTATGKPTCMQGFNTAIRIILSSPNPGQPLSSWRAWRYSDGDCIAAAGRPLSSFSR